MLWAEIAVSVDGKAVALVDKAGYLWGGTPDFKVMHVHVLVHVHETLPSFLEICSINERH